MRHTSSRLKKAGQTLRKKSASKKAKSDAAKVLVNHKNKMH